MAWWEAKRLIEIQQLKFTARGCLEHHEQVVVSAMRAGETASVDVNCGDVIDASLDVVFDWRHQMDTQWRGGSLL